MLCGFEARSFSRAVGGRRILSDASWGMGYAWSCRVHCRDRGEGEDTAGTTGLVYRGMGNIVSSFSSSEMSSWEGEDMVLNVLVMFTNSKLPVESTRTLLD